MTRDELMELDPPEIADKLNEAIAAGKDKAGALEEFGLSQADIMKAQVFFVKDKFIARAWAGYTSTKRSGNEYAQEGDGWRGDPHEFKGREVPW